MSNRGYREKAASQEPDTQSSETDSWRLPFGEQVETGPRNGSRSPARAGKRKASALDQSEQRAWVSFYRDIHDPLVAAEVIRLLDQVGEIRAERLGLYLQAKRSLRRYKQRQLQAERLAGALHAGVHALLVLPVVVPARLVWRTLRFVGNVLFACLPVRSVEPAVQRLHDLQRHVTMADTADCGSDVKPAASKAAGGKPGAARPVKAGRAV